MEVQPRKQGISLTSSRENPTFLHSNNKSAEPLLFAIVKGLYLMHESRKFVRGGPIFFCLIRGRRIKYHYQRAIIGPPTKRHLNGVSLAGR